MRRMNYLRPIIAVFSGIVFLLSSCEKEAIEQTQFSSFKSTTESVYPLYAGQHDYVGDLIVTIDDNNNLWATFTSAGECEFTEFALFVGELGDVPLSGGGTPEPGHFNYKNETGEFGPISLNGLSDDFVIIAHAVCGEETLWAQPICVPEVYDYSFKNLFGTKRWGWVIVPGDEECDDEEELIITAKVQIKNRLTAGTTWGVLSTGTPYFTTTEWCNFMSVVAVEGTNTYEVLAPSYMGSIKIADMTVENTGSLLNVTFVTDIADSFIEWSYVFVGTAEALDALTSDCPDYVNFPYSETGDFDNQHDYSISLN